MRPAAVLLGALAIFVPAAGEAQLGAPVRIVAIGDFGVGGTAQRDFGQAVRRYHALKPVDVLVTLGDNDYTENPAAFRENWQASFGWARSGGARIAGVLGNHDVRVGGGRYQFETLGMPRRYYAVQSWDVELFMLDSNRIDPAQTRWLARTLRDSSARWKLAVFHHPAFTCGGYRSHPEVVRRWAPLFERYKVRVVLSGHDHNYQRFAPRRGVRYLVHGGGGGKSYPLVRCPAGYPRRLKARREQGFLELLIRGGRLDVWAVRADGRRTDHLVVRG